jgi:hypothetical protein
MNNKCDSCGNVYDKAFQIQMAGKSYTFDSFECAAHKLAPICAHCDCRILGHGIEAGTAIFCCANCAEHAGKPGAIDRVA